MIIIRTGNLFESDSNVIVNPVNCVGVMGAGLAKEFKNRWPEMFDEYKILCDKGEIAPGNCHVFNTKDGYKIVNLPTKVHWRDPSKMEYVEEGLNWIVDNYEKHNIRDIAIPALGCGLGGLSWSDVERLMLDKFKNVPLKFELYRPGKENSRVDRKSKQKDLEQDFAL